MVECMYEGIYTKMAWWWKNAARKIWRIEVGR